MSVCLTPGRFGTGLPPCALHNHCRRKICFVLEHHAAVSFLVRSERSCVLKCLGSSVSLGIGREFILDLDPAPQFTPSANI